MSNITSNQFELVGGPLDGRVIVLSDEWCAGDCRKSIIFPICRPGSLFDFLRTGEPALTKAEYTDKGISGKLFFV